MLTNLKRRTALLLTAAVLCSVTALAPTTVGAAASVAPNTGVGADVFTAPANGTAFRACPGTSAPTGAFTDTSSTDVDCIAMFGITTGATATTYEPAGTIPRWQMALFIHRMFVPTGVAAAGLTTVPAFTDISGLSTEIQNAVNALASHSITLGTTSTTFSPDDLVSREQMALFLNRFAGIAKTSAGGAIASTITDETYNYSDIAQTSFEAMESIIRLYNLEVTEGSCTGGTQFVTAGTCLSTYRPNDSITRAEMATMITALLNHTNARPAGVSIQPTTSIALVGSEATQISVRNADFSAKSSTLVDEFFQEHDDTTGVTARPAFSSTVGTCTAANVSTAAGTLCVIDNADRVTDVRGNATGATQSTRANLTANWWVWTGNGGETYVDGSTSTVYQLSIAFGAAAAASVLGDTTTYTNSKTRAEPIDAKAALTSPAANDGIAVVAGDSVVFTATMTNAALTALGTAHTVIDGYTFKFTDRKIDHLTNSTTTSTFVPSSGGAASYTVTCDADDSTLNDTYMISHEITVSIGAADGGTGIPVGATTPIANQVGRMNQNTLNVTCDDGVRAYTAGASTNTLALASNNYAWAAAGTLASVTATAYDQYGDGIAGVTVGFRSDTNTVGMVNQSVLTTGAGGTATLTSIVCTSNGTVGWDVAVANGVMSNIGVTTPTNLIDGTTMYCTSPVDQDGTYGASTSADHVTTITANGVGDSGVLALTICSNSQAQFFMNPTATANIVGAPVCATSGTFTAAEAGIAAACQTAIRLLANVDAATTCTFATPVLTITPPANTGNWSTLVTGVTAKTAGDADIDYDVTEDGTAASTRGIPDQVWNYIDNDASANTILVSNAHEFATTAGAAGAATTTYHVVTYDSNDAFNLTAGGGVATSVSGASETQYETELASITNLATLISFTERDLAASSGIGFFNIGS